MLESLYEASHNPAMAALLLCINPPASFSTGTDAADPTPQQQQIKVVLDAVGAGGHTAACLAALLTTAAAGLPLADGRSAIALLAACTDAVPLFGTLLPTTRLRSATMRTSAGGASVEAMLVRRCTTCIRVSS